VKLVPREAGELLENPEYGRDIDVPAGSVRIMS